MSNGNWPLVNGARLHTVNPRISPLGAYLALVFLGGVFLRGAIRGGRAFKIIVDIKTTLSKDTLYFSRNFFINI